jgi:type 1 glutamine amidotransferase
MPVMTEERMPILRKQMKRGCGIVLIHYSTFLTRRYQSEMLEWEGGFFDWKGPHGYASAIKTLETAVALPSPRHPISRGVVSFTIKDEFYYKLRLNTTAIGFVPILQVPALSPDPNEQTVAWAIQREEGGRGFGTSTGRYFENWKNDNYRKLILNAIVWTAHVDVPQGGVESHYTDEAEVH